MATRADVLDTTGTLRGAATARWKAVAADFGRLVGLALVLSLAVGLLLTAAAVALPAPLQQPSSGSFLMRRTSQEPWTRAPLLETNVSLRVAGVVARARVRQRFRNATDGWVEGVYVFPLTPRSAVDHLLMKLGERAIEGQIREREPAKAEYERGKTAGRRSSLVEQEPSNVFTATVANLAPGEELEVTLELQQTLAFDEGEVRLRFPLVLAPRYVGGTPLEAGPAATGWAPDAERVPDTSRLTPPVPPPSDPVGSFVSIEVDLDAGFPVASLVSRYHPVLTEAQGVGRYHVRLREAFVPADRDFELAWTAQPGKLPTGAVFSEKRGGATYALLTLFPPAGPAGEAAPLPREVVFVVDTSRSMEGPSIQQARAALQVAIGRLQAGDRFNVIRFGDTMEPLFDLPRPVTPATLAKARRWVENLRAGGGSDMAPALEVALLGGDDPREVRQVVLLTDGAVAEQEPLFALVRERLDAARLFTVGIGPAPNGEFLAKAAELGHGTSIFVGDLHEVEEKMGRLFAALDSPVLTGIEVRWPLGAAVEAWPQRVPDLYLGEPVVVSARLEGKADAKADAVAVRGRRDGRPWETSLPLARPSSAEGVAVLWAQRKVQALLDSLHEGADPDEVRSAVVALGLEHHLVTRHTSLVAIDFTTPRPEDTGLQSTAVRTDLPNRTEEAVFGQPSRGETPVPLHAAVALVTLLLALGLLAAGHRPQARARS